MGMLNLLRSLVDNKFMGNEIVDANIRTYFEAKRLSPEGTTLTWLAGAYWGRAVARGQASVNFDIDEEMLRDIDRLPEPKNARALGLLVLAQERNDIVAAYPIFATELFELLKTSPVTTGATGTTTPPQTPKTLDYPKAVSSKGSKKWKHSNGGLINTLTNEFIPERYLESVSNPVAGYNITSFSYSTVWVQLSEIDN
jgi:hypothetical protein